MKKHYGFIALSTVLTLSAIFLSLGIAVASRAISGANTITAIQRQSEAKQLADSCAEHALIELTRTLNYSGNGSILIEGRPCTILPIEENSDHSRILKVIGTVSDYTYRTKVVIEHVSPEMKITSWEGVPHFE